MSSLAAIMSKKTDSVLEKQWSICRPARQIARLCSK